MKIFKRLSDYLLNKLCQRSLPKEEYSYERALRRINLLDFPSKIYQRISHRIGKYTESHSSQPQKILFATSWNALEYRFRAVAEYDLSFTNSIKMVGGQPELNERYNQEKSLFGFYNSGLSCIECFYFSTYAIGAMIDIKLFPLDYKSLTGVRPSEVINRFKNIPSAGKLVDEMNRINSSDKFKEWKYVRNYLSHRGSPSRHGYETAERSGETDLVLEPHYAADPLMLNNDTTAERRKWLSGQLAELMSELDSYTKKHLS